jgi:hypothetical protein
MNTKIENVKNDEILELLEQLQLKVYKLKLLFDDIVLNPDDRINLETEFRKECFRLTSTTWFLLENIGNWRSFIGVPPEQLGKPAYQPHEIEGDVSDLTGYVKSNLDSINSKRLDKKFEFDVPDITKERWLKDVESIVENMNNTFGRENKKTTPEDLTYKPDLLNNKVIFDEAIINAAKGFMVGPVGLFRNKMIAAETQTFDSLEEMRIFLLNVQCKTKDMVLYMTYEYQKPDFGDVDPLTLTFEEQRNAPKVTVYAWRGVFVDKE